ncbi:hypothetical protein EYF80_033525 [Liparis tanakae]|uniref:Uncharacterized protein n=1 Tax=Liparis tanakae TaxID=230148 RepID=A0A4Z2GU36_9TELE|nr:hypothetical protein EYF80_033525 [Liparis tanakae]
MRRTAGEVCEESSSVQVLPTWEAVSLDECTENRRLPADFHVHAHILIELQPREEPRDLPTACSSRPPGNTTSLFFSSVVCSSTAVRLTVVGQLEPRAAIAAISQRDGPSR